MISNQAISRKYPGNVLQLLTDLVGEIYEAAYNPQHWGEVLRMLCEDVLQAKSAVIGMDDYQLGTRAMLGHYGLPKAAVLTYHLGLARYDHIFKLQEKQPVGQARMIIDHVQARSETPMYYRMIMKPTDLGYVAGLGIYRSDEWHVGLGVHRGFAAEPFGQAEIDIIQTLYPHLQRAIRIHKEFSRLRAREQTLQDAMSRLALGVIEISMDGHLRYCSEMAQRMLEQHPVLSISDDGRLRVCDGAQQKALQALIDEALSDVPDRRKRNLAMGIEHGDRAHPLVVMVAPAATPGAVNLYLSDPWLPTTVSPEVLQSVYGFSPAESRVAMALVNGLGLREIAEAHGVKEETIKSQLKSLFAKAGVSRQQDLIRVLLKSALPGE